MINRIIEDIHRVVPKTTGKAAVYLSGGIDSSIILHHTCLKALGDVKAYTAYFGVDEDECEHAKRMAEWEGVDLTVVDCSNYLNDLHKIVSIFDRPRYNGWVYYLAEAAKRDGSDIALVGEGGDEHFGGYTDKDYLTGFGNHICYITPTYNYIHRHFNLEFSMPIFDLDWHKTQYWYSPKGDKYLLREAYREVLPDFVVDRPKQPPVFKQWWISQLKKYMPQYEGDPYLVLQMLVAKVWAKQIEDREFPNFDHLFEFPNL